MTLPTDMAAIDIAVGGYGIALANLHYVAGRLAEGFLVPAFDVPAFPLGGHFLESDPRMARGATRRFIAWLNEEVRSSTTQISGWCGTTRGKINIRSKPKTRHKYVAKYVLRRGLRKHRQHRRPLSKSGLLLR